jgi:hypothetical protein
MAYDDLQPMELLALGIPLSLLIDLAWGPPDVADVLAESLSLPFDSAR